MTAKKRAILECLEGQGPDDFRERGTPPHNATEVARTLGLDLSNTVKTLRILERDGLVTREVAAQSAWNAIAQNHLQRQCVCYWNTATMARDRAAAKEWREGGTRRSEAAFARMLASR